MARHKTNLATPSTMTEVQARAHLEKLRWPGGAVCPHCGEAGRSTKLRSAEGSTTRAGVWKCKPCRRQFTVSVGTIFEGSHIPLRLWVMAFSLLCSRKTAMSALQLQGTLGIGSYRSAWFLAHRIRHAMFRTGRTRDTKSRKPRSPRLRRLSLRGFQPDDALRTALNTAPPPEKKRRKPRKAKTADWASRRT